MIAQPSGQTAAVELYRSDASGAVSVASLEGVEFADGAAFTVSPKDVCLYALAVGAGRQPVFANAEELRNAPAQRSVRAAADADSRRFVWEGHPRFSALPTLAATFPFLGGASAVDSLAAWGLCFEPSALLHGEHALQLHAPLLSAVLAGPLRNHTRVVSVLDRGSGALVVLETTTRRVQDGALLATNTLSVFIRGLGGFAGRPAAPERTPRAPAPAAAVPSAPDAVVEERTEASAALLYRLTGDYNPLHVDVAAAARGGFQAPILHGLCTLGHATRAVTMRFLGGEAERVIAVRARFVGVVTPGATLQTSVWRASPTRFLFAVRADGKSVLAGGVLDLAATARL